uniref:Uncharacterized protein n=1 Tax=Arcella intermedia TaxID=1963864 RepID=A0A6B2LNE2_9EUKA
MSQAGYPMPMRLRNLLTKELKKKKVNQRREMGPRAKATAIATAAVPTIAVTISTREGAHRRRHVIVLRNTSLLGILILNLRR